MRRQRVGVVTLAIAVAAIGGGAVGQGPSATVRTYQGIAYRIGDPSLEVFYTIGEPEEKKEDLQNFAPTINVTTNTAAPGGAAPAPPPGGEKEEKLLRGHSRATEITVSREGVESRIHWDRIRAMFFTRKPVAVVGLPPYVTHYRYGVSVTLMDGERVEADYVNLGSAMLRGTTPNGRVDIPWEEVQQVIFER